MRKFTFIIACLFFIHSSQAQENNTIQGIVSTETAPLKSVTVSLLKEIDSSLVKLAVTDEAGKYEFNNILEGSYLLKATSVGYLPAFTKVNGTKTATIILQPLTSELGNVTVQSRRPLVEAKLDKMVVNVDASPSNAGATALEVLEKSPGISVDRDGNISLKGKQGVIVLMDGKQTYLSGQDLANLLRSMPASQLDQVEIMTQPSARFDAAGNSGVINLRTKKNLQHGMNGSFTTSYVQGIYPKSPNNFNFNYRKGKINLFTSGAYSFIQNANEQTLFRRFFQGTNTNVFDQQGRDKSTVHSFNARIGLDYNIKAKTTIGVLVGGNHTTRKSIHTSFGDFYKEQTPDMIDSSIVAENLQTNSFKNFTINTNFRRVLNNQ